VSLDLQSLFFALDSVLEHPLTQLKDSAQTLGEFASWCHQHNE
jgi:hypothetical protein